MHTIEHTEKAKFGVGDLKKANIHRKGVLFNFLSPGALEFFPSHEILWEGNPTGSRGGGKEILREGGKRAKYSSTIGDTVLHSRTQACSYSCS